MIYFDNSATTFFKPKEAIDLLVTAVTELSVNPNRSFNPLTQSLIQKILETRQTIANMVNLSSPSNVIFGLNCTDALNLAILGSIKRKGSHVITSVLEHNSVLRPLYVLQQCGYIQLTILEPDKNMLISPAKIENALLPNTRLVVLSHVSNVLGATQNLFAIGEVCHKNNILFLVDGAQSIGYLPIDMKKNHINMLAFPAHKGLHGIAGCGVLCFDEKSAPNPIKFGGTGTQSHILTQPTDSPEAYESGTLNSPAILALLGALNWWKDNHVKFLKQMKLVQNTILEGLAHLKKIKVRSVQNDSGIITFEITGKDSQEICDLLSENYGIATRGGLHCAPLCHKFLGTEKTGLVRASVSGSNTLEEAYVFLNAIKQISAKI